jgi:hypothetical protein
LSSDDEPRKPQLWRPVDSTIWTRGPKSTRLRRAADWISTVITAIPLAILAAVIIPIFVPLSILIVYSVAGPALLGPTLILFWSGLLVLFVFVVEKTGYARNFEDWNLPLGRILILPAALTLCLGLVFLLYFLSRL